MGWDKYIELDGVEHDGKEYDTYCSAAGYMVLTGYDPEKSERFVMVANASYHFEKNGGKERDLVTEAIAFPPETTVEKLREKYPEGPSKPKKETTTRNGLHGASVGFRKY